MKLAITKTTGRKRKYYTVDCVDLPGSPPQGHGTTKAEAVACLMSRLLVEAVTSPNGSVARMAREHATLSINGRMWKDPLGKR